MINLNINLRNHQFLPIPFDVPVITFEPTLTPVNAILLFGHSPKLYTLDLFITGSPRVRRSDHEQILALSDFLKEPILWALQSEVELAIEQILFVLKIKHDDESSNLEGDDEDD